MPRCLPRRRGLRLVAQLLESRNVAQRVRSFPVEPKLKRFVLATLADGLAELRQLRLHFRLVDRQTLADMHYKTTLAREDKIADLAHRRGESDLFKRRCLRLV